MAEPNNKDIKRIQEKLMKVGKRRLGCTGQILAQVSHFAPRVAPKRANRKFSGPGRGAPPIPPFEIQIFI